MLIYGLLHIVLSRNFHSSIPGEGPSANSTHVSLITLVSYIRIEIRVLYTLLHVAPTCQTLAASVRLRLDLEQSSGLSYSSHLLFSGHLIPSKNLIFLVRCTSHIPVSCLLARF